MIKKFNEYTKTNEGAAATTASPGSGTAVAGPGTGADGGMTFTSAAGVSHSGGDSGTSFSTNSNVSGMGAVKSAQPSSKPGDVRGSTKGSGDIGSRGGVYSKKPVGGTRGDNQPSKRKKKKKVSKRTNAIKKIDNMYTKDDGKGKVIEKLSTYKNN